MAAYVEGQLMVEIPKRCGADVTRKCAMAPGGEPQGRAGGDAADR
jgi:hypothetical protein